MRKIALALASLLAAPAAADACMLQLFRGEGDTVRIKLLNCTYQAYQKELVAFLRDYEKQGIIFVEVRSVPITGKAKQTSVEVLIGDPKNALQMR